MNVFTLQMYEFTYVFNIYTHTYSGYIFYFGKNSIKKFKNVKNEYLNLIT